MDLTEIIVEMEKEGRVPRISIEAHRKTLEALVALAKRLDAVEAPKRK